MQAGPWLCLSTPVFTDKNLQRKHRTLNSPAALGSLSGAGSGLQKHSSKMLVGSAGGAQAPRPLGAGGDKTARALSNFSKSRRIKILQRARSSTSMMTLRRSAQKEESCLVSPGCRLSIHAATLSVTKTCGLQVQENCRAQEQRAVGLLRLRWLMVAYQSEVRSASRPAGCGQSSAKRRLLRCRSRTQRVSALFPWQERRRRKEEASFLHSVSRRHLTSPT